MLTNLNILAMQFITLVAGLSFRGDSWKQTLPALVIGMLGIFLVIGIIIQIIMLHQILSQPEGGFQRAGIVQVTTVRIEIRVKIHDALIELYDIEVEFLHDAERRIAAAEIVHPHSVACFVQ